MFADKPRDAKPRETGSAKSESGASNCGYCQGCFVGEYPMPMIGELGKR
jgi:murein endopeptidase